MYKIIIHYNSNPGEHNMVKDELLCQKIEFCDDGLLIDNNEPIPRRWINKVIITAPQF